MTSSNDFSTLAQFFGGYFHQDWPEEFGSPSRAVNAFLHGEPSDVVSAVSRELEELMRLKPDDSSLAEAVGGLGCYYDPSADGSSYSKWLAQLKASLSDNV